MPNNTFAKYWVDHYTSIEIKNANTANPTLVAKIFTKQTRESRIPFARDNQIQLQNNNYQCVTAPYEIEIPMTPSEIPAITTLINNQVIKNRSFSGYNFFSNNFMEFQRGPAYTHIKESILLKQLLEHEDTLDKKINLGKDLYKEQTAQLVNTKLPPNQRVALEQEFSNYATQKATLTSRNTLHFYENAATIYNSLCKTKTERVADSTLLDYNQISKTTYTLAKKLRGVLFS